MKTLLVVIVILLTLSGCASTGAQQGKVDRITPAELAKILPPPVATLSLEEIVADSKAGKTAHEVIAKIKTSNSRYALTPTQVLDLNKQGVDVNVLDYIQQSNELAIQNAIADEMNKRAKERAVTERALRQERDFAQHRYYDPFWGPRFGSFYGNPYYGYGSRFRHRFGLGLGYGYPYGW